MSINFPSLYPAMITFAAALVAGGIARSNLIATKEAKVSEFRQAWINSLREELATLFSNIRTLARAMQEARCFGPENSSKFHFSQDKITAARCLIAETHYRIKLRLNLGQDDHKELLRLLFEMMEAQQCFMNDSTANIQLSLSTVERASEHAEKVLRNEWCMVKVGEEAYRGAIRTTSWVLIISGAIWATVMVGAPVYAFLTDAAPLATSASNPATQQLHARAAPPAVEVLTPRQSDKTTSKQSITK